MDEMNDVRERAPEAGAWQSAMAGQSAAVGRRARPVETKWPVGFSVLVAIAVSTLLWAGIIVSAIRLWRSL
jgi:hypothetical protein